MAEMLVVLMIDPAMPSSCIALIACLVPAVPEVLGGGSQPCDAIGQGPSHCALPTSSAVQ